MKTSEKLIDRLNKELGFELDKNIYKPKSLHTGKHQKNGGAFSWYIPNTLIGSEWTMTEILKAEKIYVYYNLNGHIEIEIKNI